MKIRIVAPLIALAFAAGAQAQSQASKTVPVTATITGACSIHSGSQAIAIGVIDPSSTGRKTSPATNVSFNCTRGLPFIVTVAGWGTASGGTASGMKMLSGLNELPFDLTWSVTDTVGRGFGPGTDVDLVLTAAVEEADYRTAAVGDYSKDVLIEIHP
jgi:spore coat protein U-like protein